jgi:starch-binding outer membrane protein, SusD/RagB family
MLDFKFYKTMRTKYKNTIKQLAVAFALTATIAGCKEDFLEIEDRNGVDSNIWNSEASVQFLLNETYDVIMPEFPYVNSSNYLLYASDEDRFSGNDAIMRKFVGTNGVLVSNDVKFIAQKYQGTNKGDNRYFDIAKCNAALAGLNSQSTISDAKKKEFRGQFYSLRALAYFELVPLVLEPQKPESPEIDRPRATSSQCFKAIVRDLDSAMTLLTGFTPNQATERGKWTREAAAALKGRALLYWASPQFNPENDPTHTYVPARWDTAYAACKEAYNICKAKHSLLADYSKIFSTEGHAEAIIVRSYSSKAVKYGHDTEYRVRPLSEGGTQNTSGGNFFAPTWNLVQAYTMKDGTPISATGSGYDQNAFWINRDPRLDATVAYNGSTWALSGKLNRRQWAYNTVTDEGSQLTSTGFYLKKYSSPDLLPASVRYQNDFGGNGFDWIDLRFAEVMINYAEAANEVGIMAEAKDMIRQIRVRAGITAGTKDYGLALATDKAKMRDLIMNERMVEFAMEGKRFYDLRRTRRLGDINGRTLDKVTYTLKTVAGISNTKTFLESINSQGVLNRDTINMNNKASYSKFFSVAVSAGVTTPMSTSDTYYFFALPSTFMNSSPLLDQTIGWDGGLFNPLK